MMYQKKRKIRHFMIYSNQNIHKIVIVKQTAFKTLSKRESNSFKLKIYSKVIVLNSKSTPYPIAVLFFFSLLIVLVHLFLSSLFA